MTKNAVQVAQSRDDHANGCKERAEEDCGNEYAFSQSDAKVSTIMKDKTLGKKTETL
jgi:hypothetical protein